jgi:hypothetical protein
MPVEDAGEREEKQRDEPSQLSSLWEDAGISERTSAFYAQASTPLPTWGASRPEVPCVPGLK